MTPVPGLAPPSRRADRGGGPVATAAARASPHARAHVGDKGCARQYTPVLHGAAGPSGPAHAHGSHAVVAQRRDRQPPPVAPLPAQPPPPSRHPPPRHRLAHCSPARRVPRPTPAAAAAPPPPPPTANIPGVRLEVAVADEVPRLDKRGRPVAIQPRLGGHARRVGRELVPRVPPRDDPQPPLQRHRVGRFEDGRRAAEPGGPSVGGPVGWGRGRAHRPGAGGANRPADHSDGRQRVRPHRAGAWAPHTRAAAAARRPLRGGPSAARRVRPRRGGRPPRRPGRRHSPARRRARPSPNQPSPPHSRRNPPPPHPPPIPTPTPTPPPSNPQTYHRGLRSRHLDRSRRSNSSDTSRISVQSNWPRRPSNR